MKTSKKKSWEEIYKKRKRIIDTCHTIEGIMVAVALPLGIFSFAYSLRTGNLFATGIAWVCVVILGIETYLVHRTDPKFFQWEKEMDANVESEQSSPN